MKQANAKNTPQEKRRLSHPHSTPAKRKKSANRKSNRPSTQALLDLARKEIEVINSEYFISTLGGNPLICHETKDDYGRDSLTYLREPGFKLLFKNRGYSIPDYKGNQHWRGIADMWLLDKWRREYKKGIIFSPHKDMGPEFYNLWRGFGVTPLPGEPVPFLEFIHDVICNARTDHYKYLIAWMADIVQNPDPNKKPGVALALRGIKGTGKTFFSEKFGKLFGQHFQIIESSEQLTGRFNIWAQDCVLLLADEIGWAGDRHDVGRLQSLITNPIISIEPKGVNRFQAPNFVHVIMCGNDARVVPASTNERRYFVLDISEHNQNDHSYFRGLAEYMDSEGSGKLLGYLQKYNLKEMELRRVPMTDALEDNIDMGMTTIQLFWKGHIEREKLPHPDSLNLSLPWNDDPPQPLEKSSIYSFYLEGEAKHRRRPVPNETFWVETKRMFKLSKDTQPRDGDKRIRCILLPKLSEARRLFDRSRNPMGRG
jgi:hypothetical protein